LKRHILLAVLVVGLFAANVQGAAGEPSVARKWNVVLLEAIRHDFARPIVHARNLFHISIALYDAWAVFDTQAVPFLLGRTVNGIACGYDSSLVDNTPRAAERAMSVAAHRLLRHRFRLSPGGKASLARFDSLLVALQFDANDTKAEELGRRLADCIIDMGWQDGSYESDDYASKNYLPLNPPLLPVLPGNPDLIDPDRWQPLSLDVFIDQAGNPIPLSTPDFFGPEWGQVTPFALSIQDLTVYEREGRQWLVYHDPGAPPYFDPSSGSGPDLGVDDDYKWGFALVSAWSSHMDPGDGVMWDISPGAIGNLGALQSFTDLRDFYDLREGGDGSPGRDLNPRTGQPYDSQWVPRGDYTRVLAEFWADGPDSETPPGHWFALLNIVSDDPALQKRFGGVGPVVDDLEWDVKAYFTLGGAMHDAAVAAWGIKGWYDYIRPISAIRAMADRGQSSDPSQPSYDPGGLPLIEGYIEVVEEGDPTAGSAREHIGKIQLRSWRGPRFVDFPRTQTAGVGWILAENWWPYQRSSFVTPPFAGYVSGHSTFSRAAAEVLTVLTGDPYFPGGLGQFFAPKDEFLVFEDGPSVDVTLQWATYRDAADQCSLSRIWGGIHPPADDLPGRLIGERIGRDAFSYALTYFADQRPVVGAKTSLRVFPNPLVGETSVTLQLTEPLFTPVRLHIYNLAGQRVRSLHVSDQTTQIDLTGLANGVYFLSTDTRPASTTKLLVMH